MMTNQQTAYIWDVKIDANLRKDVTIYAVEKQTEIRKIVSDAVREYMQKTKNKKGEK